ncbi:hypothetical protein [Pseudohongiella sp.]|uniref:Uncharacterized protein n=1 Tax=marine sediment metagenome TaxID=412755 RepID=A0A0F9W466_9ZZZZ|nr:hypothetical protein [Pseudohongiella sp.]HDZ10232.1 hypothetical protein [Pseudohongiella sp.]HEA64212.1 hypothetical protein [Pseudohongiella sp.]
MTIDLESLEDQLRQRPPITDHGFSQAVLRRIAAQRRRRQQTLLALWALAIMAALIVATTQFETWAAHLQPLTSTWATHAGQMLSGTSWQLGLKQLWQPSGEMVVTGLIALLLTTVFVAVWD